MASNRAAGLLLLLTLAISCEGSHPELKPQDLAGFTEEELSQFSKRFETEIWPLLTRGKKNCVTCHDHESDSQLHLVEEPEAAFKRLLVEGRLDPKSPTSLIPRLVTTARTTKMPKAPEAEVALLRNFGTELHLVQRKEVAGMDEKFPMELLAEYHGRKAPSGKDTTFLTYYQLRRKVKAIFGDDWVRDGKDLFNENIALFKGADFVRSFNESTTASATFLGGIDLLAADISTRAYLRGSGPFEGHPASLPSPLERETVDDATRAAIQRLFNRILFRDASEREVDSAYRMIRSIALEEAKLSQQARELRFDLKVEDPEGRTGVADLRIPLSAGTCGLTQEHLDQHVKEGNKRVKRALARTFTFKAGDATQQFQIHNSGSHGNVSIAAIELAGPLPDRTVRTIPVSDPSVRILGAWTLKDAAGFPSYEDQDENKGDSSLIIPIRVDADGSYELSVVWRGNDGAPENDNRGRRKPVILNAESVRVEVLSHDATRHTARPSPAVPPPGQARFFIDQTLSNIPYWELNTSFQFGPGDGVEINNAGTRRTVVADAVHFAGAAKFMVRGVEADGQDKWKEFNAGQFKPYNTFGPKLLADEGEKKGDLKLLYRPSVKKAEWKENEFYKISISCPGKAGNESRAPVIVHARQSSPILQVSAPEGARAGGSLTLDASACYNLQKTALKFTWIQTGGPKVELADPHAAVVTFSAPVLTARQAAWEGLCRALLRHPDFLFTRPPSASTVQEPKARERLLLVKVAQDLVGRTPNEAELGRLEKGTPLPAFVNEYLDSQEFRDFYFRRIRLVLESHGSELDDEPTRLWCYVAFNDRPFKEILTADYSVDKNLKPQPRPAYYGKTGLLTMKGFIEGKPGLPHFNYAAVVCEKFLGYVFEVPATIVAQREGATAASTTHPDSTCYSCHKILTPLAFQRTKWTDDGKFREKDEKGAPIDATDHNLVASYPFKGEGMEAFALGAQNKERFIRTMIQTHFVFYFGREMRYEDEERGLYRRLWDNAASNNYSIRALLREMLTCPEYLETRPGATGGK
ncbi:MAG: hypothetical protein HY293_00350 [Planctomycetes bacterium]|nr:hypothetical protein [Planctomycetota bacterium]